MAELTAYGHGVATADPELRFVGQKGTPVCTVNLAFNRSYKGQGDSEWQKETCFMRVTMWGKRAETMGGAVKKGMPVYVTGHIKQDSWEKDGQKRIAFSIVARDFQLCQKINGENRPQAPVTPNETSQPDNGDDIPF